MFGPLKKSKIILDLKHLIYPEICLSCGNELSHSEKHLCGPCGNELSYTNMNAVSKEENRLEKLFWGRIPLVFGYTHLFFEKKAVSQKVLFRIKYRSDPKLAVFFGGQIGTVLKEHYADNLPDIIIPIPLHHRKKFIRGYNQSEELAKGMEKTSGIPYSDKLVKRRRFTETQTKKSRFERWENLSEAFEVSDTITQHRHLLLVDDVATTGSTIEQVYLTIRAMHPEVRVSVVTLAIA